MDKTNTPAATTGYIKRSEILQIIGDPDNVYEIKNMPAKLIRATHAALVGMRAAIDLIPDADDVIEARYGNMEKSAISKTGYVCTACYSDIDKDSVFCKYCGAKININ